MKPNPYFRWRGISAFAAVILVSGIAAGATSYKQPGFSETVAFNGLVNPTTVHFLPDGRVLS